MKREAPHSSGNWYVARWPRLAWLETALKLAALTIGIMAGLSALSAPTFALPSGVRLLETVVLALLSVGLIAAIGDRWMEREVTAMVFVVINNLGHWGMFLTLLTQPWPASTLFSFAGLMLLGDVVKLVFIRVHRFTVRTYSTSLLIGLTSVYVVGYAIICLVELLG